MQATQQQVAILRSAREGNHLMVKARAGTGKTSTIELERRDNLEKSALLLCFNKDIRVAAEERMPANTTCKTFHQLGWFSHGKYFQHRQKLRFIPNQIARRLEVNPDYVNVMRHTVRRFTSSADNFIANWHIPREAVQSKSESERNAFMEEVVCGSRKLWNLKTNFKEKEIPVEFDDWLKMFQLDKTRFKGRYDAVIVDEAQDVTPRDLAIVHNIPGQKIFVGDDFQQLYAWRGSVNSFEELGINDELFLTQSFRFGEAIAEKANDVLALLQHDTPKIVGYANQHSTVSFSGSPQEKHTILCRTNTGLLANTLTSIRNGKLVHVVGNLMESINLLESAYYLSIGRNHLVKHPTMTLISDWNVLVELAQHDTDLKVLIKQVEEYKGAIPSICEELRMAGDVPPHRADIIVSTVHKAKGMEWDTVKLHDDFPELVYFSRKDRCYKVKKAEVYCLYVAITRARKQLYANPIMTQVKGWQDVLI